MAKTLQELRKEAGYKSAKDFAEAIGMSESTYSRYESNPDNINMKAAIKLADFLHCSLDMIMGREPVNIEDMRGDVQKFYDALSKPNQELFDEYCAFLTMREKDLAKKRRALEEANLRDIARVMELQFIKEDDEDIALSGSPEAIRKAYEAYVYEHSNGTEEERAKLVKGIMKAYDKMHPQKKGRYEYYLMQLD